MASNTSTWKENILTWLIILTFFIPVIPFGVYFIWNGLTNSGSSANSRVVETDSLGEDSSSSSFDEGDSYSPTYRGYSCTYDCSGHEAGYEWASDNDVCDEEFDGGNSESFAEGVRSYAEENCSSYYDDYDEDYYEDESYYEDDYYEDSYYDGY